MSDASAHKHTNRLAKESSKPGNPRQNGLAGTSRVLRMQRHHRRRTASPGGAPRSAWRGILRLARRNAGRNPSVQCGSVGDVLDVRRARGNRRGGRSVACGRARGRRYCLAAGRLCQFIDISRAVPVSAGSCFSARCTRSDSRFRSSFRSPRRC